MTDNIGEQMTEEELHAAQPEKDYKFYLADQQLREEYRNVGVPNWMARDGHWADVWNALQAAQGRKMATATEMIVKAMERARQFGREESSVSDPPVRDG
jgi:hypothetical protein